MRSSSHIGQIDRLVVKVGTRLLSDEKFLLDEKAVGRVAGQMRSAREHGAQAVLVTSGAVAAGMGALGLKKRPTAIVDKQACAAVGQSLLMHQYQRAFSRHDVRTAQVLFTRADVADRTSHQNIRRVLKKLLDDGVLPIVNENDVVAVEELRFGDNDSLSGLVADLVEADMLIILTDVDGLYADDGGARRRIPVVPSVTPEILSHAGGAGSEGSVGGMVTKLQTAERMARAGRVTVIASGRDSDAVAKILRGEDVGTVFLPSGSKLAARKRWIADHLQPAGVITVDRGCANALARRGGSLLPSGILRVAGDFGRGAAVSVTDESGAVLGQGLAAYSSREIARIRGLRSDRIAATLGYSHGDEVIHRDDLAVHDGSSAPVNVD